MGSHARGIDRLPGIDGELAQILLVGAPRALQEALLLRAMQRLPERRIRSFGAEEVVQLPPDVAQGDAGRLLGVARVLAQHHAAHLHCQGLHLGDLQVLGPEGLPPAVGDEPNDEAERGEPTALQHPEGLGVLALGATERGAVVGPSDPVRAMRRVEGAVLGPHHALAQGATPAAGRPPDAIALGDGVALLPHPLQHGVLAPRCCRVRAGRGYGGAAGIGHVRACNMPISRTGRCAEEEHSDGPYCHAARFKGRRRDDY
mmetsp:Transcript_117208/g.328033  ORF Transcript_117208/g.328033 Transcript_117208/m.328033 type:complete len:259 (+) Transcript_117208:925-1701(+)